MTDRAIGRSRRLYYGWIIVLACNGVACITWGVAIFNQGVFAAYWIGAYGWSPAALAGAPALFQLWAGCAGIPVGRIVDRYGPQPALLAGAGFLSAGLGLVAITEALWQVYAAFLLLGSGFACIHTVTLGKIVARWFMRRRARAMAAATLGAGIGGATLVPLNAWLIQTAGIETACLALAGITVATLLPLAIFVIKDGPETLGLAIDGGEPAGAKLPEAAVTAAEAHDLRDWTLGQAMAGPNFWALACCLGFGMLAQSAFLFHQTPFLETRVGLMAAAGIVSATTLSGLVGRAVFLILGDRLSIRHWMTIVYALQAAAFLILAFAAGPTGLTLGSMLFGATMGLVITLQPLSVAHVFGRISFGRIYGAIYFAIRTGAALGPLAVGAVLLLAAGYETGWLAVACSLGIAIALLPLALRPNQTHTETSTDT